MRVGVIDLGTNTFNLLLAEVNSTGFDVILSTKEGVALGKGGIHKNEITQEAFERAIATINRFMQLAIEYQVEEIRAIGTSAIRDAKNAQDLVVKLKHDFNLELEIIDGKAEADYIYKGVSWMSPINQDSLIMDIGGGSTELIQCNKDGVVQAVSLNIGVSRVIQQFKLEDPLTEENKKEVLSFFDVELSKSGFQIPKINLLIGASGSFETFYELMYKMEYPNQHERTTLDYATCMEMLNSLIKSTDFERNQNKFILPIRRKMAHVAALKTKWILEQFQIETIEVSPASLKEGVLRNMYLKQ